MLVFACMPNMIKASFKSVPIEVSVFHNAYTYGLREHSACSYCIHTYDCLATKLSASVVCNWPVFFCMALCGMGKLALSSSNL